MMVEVNGEDIERMHVEFLNEKKYHKRVAFFEKYFGIVPYDLPFFDSELSWFMHAGKTMEIIEIFDKENNPATSFYERVFFVNGHVINFSIKPVTRMQRSLLSKSIIRHFIKDKEILRALVKKELEGATDHVSYIKDRLSELDRTIGWITKKLDEFADSSLKIKFLAIFYKGYSSFYEDERTLLVRRRIIVLYLYSQGLLFSNYQNILREKLEELRSNHTNNPPPLVRLALLDKLGIIKYLKQACISEDETNKDERIAKLLSFIINENEDLYCAILSCLRSGNLSDPYLMLSEQERKTTNKVLKHFGR